MDTVKGKKTEFDGCNMVCHDKRKKRKKRNIIYQRSTSIKKIDTDASSQRHKGEQKERKSIR